MGRDLGVDRGMAAGARRVERADQGFTKNKTNSWKCLADTRDAGGERVAWYLNVRPFYSCDALPEMLFCSTQQTLRRMSCNSVPAFNRMNSSQDSMHFF